MFQKSTRCFLMGSEENHGTITDSSYGSMTDINVWDRYFNLKDIEDFHYCQEIKHKKILDWTSAEVNVQGYVLKEDRIEMICEKKEDKIVIGNLKGKSFDKSISFCDKAFNSRIAVLNHESMRAITEEVASLKIATWIFTGYTRDLSISDEQQFVNIYDNSPMPNFTWRRDQPNNFGGNQNCVLYDPGQDNIGDLECSEEWISLCQVKVNTVFQLSGICPQLDIDDTFIISKVSISLEMFNSFSIN